MISKSERREVWTTIFIFLAIVTGLSAIFHLAIVNLMPTSLYVGPLMWSPAVAALLTLRVRGRAISSLPWQWGEWTNNRHAFMVPILYVLVAYALIWTLGLGGVPNEDTLTGWAESAGLEDISTPSPSVEKSGRQFLYSWRSSPDSVPSFIWQSSILCRRAFMWAL